MNEDLKARLQTTQILVGALMMGVVMFCGVSVLLVVMESAPMLEAGPLHMILLGAAAVVWVGSLGAVVVMGNAMTARYRQIWETSPGEGPEDVIGSYSTMMVLKAALLEGPGLFGTVVFLLTGEWVALVIPALSVVSMALVFPTRGRFRGFASRVIGGHAM